MEQIRIFSVWQPSSHNLVEFFFFFCTFSRVHRDNSHDDFVDVPSVHSMSNVAMTLLEFAHTSN